MIWVRLMRPNNSTIVGKIMAKSNNYKHPLLKIKKNTSIANIRGVTEESDGTYTAHVETNGIISPFTLLPSSYTNLYNRPIIKLIEITVLNNIISYDTLFSFGQSATHWYANTSEPIDKTKSLYGVGILGASSKRINWIKRSAMLPKGYVKHIKASPKKEALLEIKDKRKYLLLHMREAIIAKAMVPNSIEYPIRVATLNKKLEDLDKLEKQIK